MIRMGTKDGSFADLESVLAELNPPASAFWWVRWRTHARLSCSAPSDIGKSFEGRVFWEAGEMQWKILEKGLRIVWCGEEILPGLSKQMEVVSLEVEKRKDIVCPLDHSHTMDFSTLPRIGSGELLCLKTREYQTKEQGAFSRFLAVIPESSSWKGFREDHDAGEVEDA